MGKIRTEKKAHKKVGRSLLAANTDIGQHFLKNPMVVQGFVIYIRLGIYMSVLLS